MIFLNCYKILKWGWLSSKWLTVYLFCLLSFLMSSCSDDLEIRKGFIPDIDENNIIVDFLIPEETHISSRAYDENGVNHLTVFIFNNDENGELIQKLEYDATKLNKSSNSNQFTINIPKNDAVKKADKLWIYAIANAQSELNSIMENSSSKEDIDNISKSSVFYNQENEAQGFYMAGTAQVSSNTEIDLIRTAAKVSVKNESTNGKFVLTGFELFNPATECYVTAGVTEKKYENSPLTGNEIIEDAFDKGYLYENGTSFYRYTNPCFTSNFYKDNKTDVEDVTIYTYIVITGTFTDKNYPNGITSYYAIPLFDQTERKHYDIDPNHWYDITIKEVNNKGEDSKIDAIKSPCDYIIYEIHDHAGEIFSMVSDGVHELGVRGVVEIDPANTEDDGKPMGYLTVKLYSANRNEAQSISSDLIEFDITSMPWFEILKNSPEEVTPTNTDPEDNPGKQYRYKVKLTNIRYSEQSQEVKVSWKNLNLSRTVTIHYNPGFNIAEACKVNLLIKDETGVTQANIDDYWKFLSQDNNYRNFVLYGVGSNEMADGKIRNQGFHLPMPFGLKAPNNSWTYEYNIDFSFLNSDSRKISNITCTTSGNTELASMINWSNNSANPEKGVLKLADGYKNSYKYISGKIIFHLTYDNKESRSVTVDLYHTGFFHHDTWTETFMADNEYYYYEVIEMEGEHWLDRNLGAKSNRMFVDDSSNDGLGYKDARGQFIKICKYEPAQYADPTVITDMCPPGYHIPVSSEWNSIRLSSNFISPTVNDNGQTYISTYYKSAVGNVYFPRAKYYNSTNNNPITWYQEEAGSGDPSTGYYWTATAAPGMEKLEMGKWLRALYINGSNSTYQNINVVESKMNVRCIAGASIPSQDNFYVSLFVHNVTHVYLFDPSSGAALYTFPGDAVGSTASSAKWQNFTCFTSVDINTLGVLFAKKEIDGSITLYTRSNTNNDAFSSFNVTSKNFSTALENAIKNKNYWNVENGLFYDFCIKKDILDEDGNVIDSINYKEKREKDNKSNVYASQPELNENLECEYCSYTEKAESSSGGGGGNHYFDFAPEFDNEIDTEISQVQFGNNWGSGNNQELANGGYDWSKVTVGSKIKLYIVPTGGDAIIQAFTNPGYWSQIGEYRPYRDHKDNATYPDIKVIEIELNSIILNRIKTENGFIVQGVNCVLVGITIIINENSNGEDDVPPIKPDDPDAETIIWQGNQYVNWYGGPYITITDWDGGNWNSFNGQKTLKVYAYPLMSGGGWYCYSLRYADNDWTHLDGDVGVQIGYPNGSQEFTLTSAIIEKLKNQGLLITGENALIRLVTIK